MAKFIYLSVLEDKILLLVLTFSPQLVNVHKHLGASSLEFVTLLLRSLKIMMHIFSVHEQIGIVHVLQLDSQAADLFLLTVDGIFEFEDIGNKSSI